MEAILIKDNPPLGEPKPVPDAVDPSVFGYDPEAPASADSQKMVVDMTQDDMLKLMIQAVVKANRIKGDTGGKGRQFDEDRHPFAKGVGFIGDVAHSVVDVAEGTLRGAVDILTFGQSKGR